MTTYDASLDYRMDGAKPFEKVASLAEKNYVNDSDSEMDFDESGKSRNRFLKFLLLNALIWPMIAYVGYQISESHAPEISETLQTTSGIKALSAEELAATVMDEGRPVFWLGRLSGDRYTDITTKGGVDVITYLPQGVDPANLNQFGLIIKTYRDGKLFNTQLHPLLGPNSLVVEHVGGVTVSYDPQIPDHSIVTFKDRPQIVTINYPGFQNPSTIVLDAQNLTSIL